jgi:hypothetical protein
MLFAPIEDSSTNALIFASVPAPKRFTRVEARMGGALERETDVAFIAGLMPQRVPFIVAELRSDTHPFMLHLCAATPIANLRSVIEPTSSAIQCAVKRLLPTLGRRPAACPS